MDCSFTVLDGVRGCKVGIVPPCGLADVCGLAADTLLPSLSRRLLTVDSPDGRIDPTFCCPSNLAFNFDALPPTLCSFYSGLVGGSDFASSYIAPKIILAPSPASSCT